MQFSFQTATNIIFKSYATKNLKDTIKPYGKRILLVLGKNMKRHQEIIDQLLTMYTVDLFQVPYEPTLTLVLEGVKKAKVCKCDVVLAIGGGSVIDTAKAISALTVQEGDVLDYLEIVGKGKPLMHKPIPFIAVPTTSGTGAEVTKNAVILVEEKHLKVSLRSDMMLPTLAIIDPSLTLSLPKEMTAYTGMDAITQIIEPYVSLFANPLTDSLIEKALPYSASLIKAYQHGNSLKAKEEMAYLSLIGGLSLANAKLGAVHGFAGVLGGMFKLPHGLLCAQLLPSVTKENIKALESHDINHPTLKKYTVIAQKMMSNMEVNYQDLGLHLENMLTELNIPRKNKHRLSFEMINNIIEIAKSSSSMKGNPIDLEDEVLKRILLTIFEKENHYE